MGKFIKGKKRPAKAGRRPGSVNRTTGLLKEAILLAAELEGDVSLQDVKKSALLYRESDEEAEKKRGGSSVICATSRVCILSRSSVC
jgi:hypothetical protein